MTQILIVEDDPDIARYHTAALTALGTIQRVGSIKEFVASFPPAQPAPDVAVIDLGLPDGSFLTLAQDPVWAARLKSWAILFVSMQDEIGVIEGALAGTRRDYLTKPCNPNLLLAKCRTLLRQSAGDEPKSPLHPLTFKLEVQDLSSEPLTALEAKIFNALWQGGEAGMTRDALAEQVWQEPRARKKLEVSLSRMRKKTRTVGIDITMTGENVVLLRSTRT